MAPGKLIIKVERSYVTHVRRGVVSHVTEISHNCRFRGIKAGNIVQFFRALISVIRTACAYFFVRTYTDSQQGTTFLMLPPISRYGHSLQADEICTNESNCILSD